jgi:polar amino acid transport system substrate-binding protein
MKKLILAAAAALTIPGAFSGAMAQETVRIGTEGLYPPYNFINDAGKLDGFEIDLGNEICKRAALTCTFVQNDWDSMMPNLNSSNFDVIMAGMNITDERKKDRLFTQAYYPPATSYYVALSPNVDLKGGYIAAQTGTVQAAHVAESGAKLVEFKTPDETVAAVRNGEADAVLADKDFLAPMIEQSNGELVLVDQVSLGEGIGGAFRMSDKALVEKFDTVITAMKADGSLNELLKKWFKDQAVLF